MRRGYHRFALRRDFGIDPRTGRRHPAPLERTLPRGINFFGCVNGVVRDVFLFGNATNFAPEHTLRNGRTERIAMLFRVRRFLAMCFRAAVYGDVPFGAFWFGWQATAWTPSGYDGWTTGKAPRSMLLPPAAPAPSPTNAPVNASVPAAPRTSLLPMSASFAGHHASIPVPMHVSH